MNTNDLIELGNSYRNNTEPDKALECYAQVFIKEPTNPHAWNNYGNVLREMGEPKRAIPFLQHAIALVPDYVTANFNLSVAYLLSGDLKNGLAYYEWRWLYEHLAGMLPNLSKPRWEGQDLQGKTILVTWEQGLGDTIQFVRFFRDLKELGAKTIFYANDGMKELFENNNYMDLVVTNLDEVEDYDYWTPTMSIPKVLGTTYETLRTDLEYITANPKYTEPWAARLGPKTKMRIGICWSGRKDSWINQHKSVPLEKMLVLINANPHIDWINLQANATDEETQLVLNSPMKIYPGSIRHWGDTAGLLHHCDLVISVDTSIAHLAGAMGKQLWIPLNNFATDWRYLLDTGLSPWYPTARIFRQPTIGDWDTVLNAIHLYLEKVNI